MATKSKFGSLPSLSGAKTAPDAGISRRDNPAYVQISAYVAKDVYKKVKMRILETEQTISEGTEDAFRLLIKQK